LDHTVAELVLGGCTPSGCVMAGAVLKVVLVGVAERDNVTMCWCTRLIDSGGGGGGGCPSSRLVDSGNGSCGSGGGSSGGSGTTECSSGDRVWQ